MFIGGYNITIGITNILGYPVCALIQSKIFSTYMLVKGQDFITEFPSLCKTLLNCSLMGHKPRL